MSVDYQVFMKTSRNLSQIAAGLHGFTGVRFERSMPQDEEVYSARVFGHWMYLYDTQGFEDDKEIALTQYQYCLSMESGDLDWHPDHEVWHEQVARMLACLLANVYASECIVTRDIQRIVARFPSP